MQQEVSGSFHSNVNSPPTSNAVCLPAGGLPRS